MIIDQLEEKINFTNAEKEIATYILNNLSKITALSANKLGKKTFTSKATVIRFCKKLEFSGYEEFKQKLAIELNEKYKLKLLLEQEPVNQDTTLKELFTIVPTIYQNAIDNTSIMIDENSFSRIITKLQNASIVDIYGSGITYACATTAKFKFRTLGINCNTYSGINEHYIMATRKQRNRIAIILSFTGANNSMIEIAQYLKDNGTFVIGIGGNESVNLKNICNEYIEIFSKQLIMSMEVLTPYIAITYVFDLLFGSLLVADFDKNLEYSIDVLNYKEKPPSILKKRN